MVIVVEYRSGEDGLFHCLKNKLSLHLCPRMGGITMNTFINLQRAGLFLSKVLVWISVTYFVMCASVQRKICSRTVFLSTYGAQECSLQIGKNKGVLVEGGGLEPTCLRGAVIPAWFPRHTCRSHPLHGLRVQFWGDSSRCLGEQGWQVLLTEAGS